MQRARASRGKERRTSSASVVELLDALAGRDRVTLAIGTGNGREGAIARLEAAGVAHHFDRAGLGDEHDDRVAILREAAEDAGQFDGDRHAHGRAARRRVRQRDAA